MDKRNKDSGSEPKIEITTNEEILRKKGDLKPGEAFGKIGHMEIMSPEKVKSFDVSSALPKKSNSVNEPIITTNEELLRKNGVLKPGEAFEKVGYMEIMSPKSVAKVPSVRVGKPYTVPSKTSEASVLSPNASHGISEKDAHERSIAQTTNTIPLRITITPAVPSPNENCPPIQKRQNPELLCVPSNDSMHPKNQKSIVHSNKNQNSPIIR